MRSLPTWMKAVGLLVGGYFLLMGTSGLILSSLLTEERISSLTTSLEERLPVKLSTSGGGFDLLGWFFLRPAINLNDIALADPESESSAPFFTARRMDLSLELLPLAAGRVNIRHLIVDRPELTVELRDDGRTNLQAILERGDGQAENNGGREANSAAVTIDTLELRDGTLRLAGGEQQTVVARDLSLKIDDFGSNRNVQVQLETGLFESGESALSFEGAGGPFSGASFPAEAILTGLVRVGDIPKAWRIRYLGELLEQRPDSGQAELSAELRGDLLGQSEGKGSLLLEGIQIGGKPEALLPISGQFPLQVVARRLATNPSIRAASEESTVRFGEGEWTGSVQIQFDKGRLKGSSDGKIAGVDINELLGALASSEDLIFGKGEIPRYRLSFEGDNADSIRRSMRGTGSLQLKEGRIALFNLMHATRDVVRGLLSSGQSETSGTPFTELQTELRVADEVLRLQNLSVVTPFGDVTGNGSVTFSKQLNFDLVAAIGGSTRVPLSLTGTTSDPKLRPNLREGVVKDLLKSIFGGSKPPRR